MIKQDTKKNKEEATAMYENVRQDIQSLVSAVSQIITNHKELTNKNFGLFYQHGRLGYVDLDAFAKTVDTEALQKAKDSAEKKKEVDKK